jgi:hypothetical protein
MPRKEHTHHFIYKTTNLINGKYYIGMHSTNNLNDGYIGSGKRIRRSINKYGKEKFKFEILEFLPDRRSLKEREKELVDDDLLKDNMCMNLMCGGHGGFISKECQIKRSIAGGKANAIYSVERFKNNPDLLKKYRETSSNNVKKRKENGTFIIPTFKGKKHKPETIEKMQKSKNQKEKNSQFGTCWITNGIENKKIQKKEFIKYQNEWKYGRQIK